MKKEFNSESLSEFDGKEGSPVYVARDGKVYDVSESKLWRGGEHMKRHHAGRDLSEDFANAPHGTGVFENFPVVGTFHEEETAEKVDDNLPGWIQGILDRYPFLQRHPHPMLVHFPIAFMFAVPLFAVLWLMTGKLSFETTSFHCLAAGLLFMPLTVGTGFMTWWLNYDARMVHPVKMKIIGSGILTLLGIILFVWRFSSPEIILAGTGSRTVYILLLVTLLPLVSVIGWYGASLTFPGAKKS